VSDVPELPFAPAAERNRGPILEALRPRLPENASVLEIGAGTGQHAVAFTHALPGLDWLPTEHPDALSGLAVRCRAEGGDGLRPPRALDVLGGPWPEETFQAVFTANTAHIMPWAAVQAMVDGAARCLAPEGRLLVYGPFHRDGRPTSEGNERFDRALRASDPAQGIRDLEALEREGRRHHLRLEEALVLPANNLLLVLRKS